jgi:hypothetical protein
MINVATMFTGGGVAFSSSRDLINPGFDASAQPELKKIDASLLAGLQKLLINAKPEKQSSEAGKIKKTRGASYRTYSIVSGAR